MAERLPIVRLKPQTVVAWALQVGGGAAEIKRAYPQARLLPVEPMAAPTGAASTHDKPVKRPWWPFRRKVPAAVAPADLPEAAGELLWSNMTLHGSAEPQALLRAWHRALAVDGFLMFSTLGPGTLQSLRDLYRAEGWPVPNAPLVDMHDLGDMLIEAGFADPVMDQETVTLTWPDATAALAELRTLGGNVALQRFAGLRTPRWRARLAAALAQRATRADGAGGRIALDFEIVYGHAFRPAPRPRLAPETLVSVDDMRAMVRAGVRRP
jgi:malonyl-CoA O-methyltransferase